MKGALFLTAVVVLASVCVGVKVNRATRAQRIVDDFRIISHGSFVHLVPDDGTLHAEDPSGSCPCGTFAGNYQQDDGATGWLIIHRQMPERRAS